MARQRVLNFAACDDVRDGSQRAHLVEEQGRTEGDQEDGRIAMRYSRAHARAADRQMLSACELSERWGVNVKTVYEGIKAGTIPCVRLGRSGRCILIPRAYVDASEAQDRAAPPGGNHGGQTR